MGQNRHRLGLIIALAAGAALADQGPPVYTAIGSVPLVGGACSGPRVQIEANTGKRWCCVNSKWATCDAGGGGGGGSPGGSSGNLQTNNGSGGFGAFAGSSCGAGTYASAISASGAVTCSAVPSDLTIPVYTRAALPACGSTWLSKEARVHDSGFADETLICEFDDLGAYAWTIYSQAPSVVRGAQPDGSTFVQVGWNIDGSAGSGGSYTVTSTSTGASPCAMFTQGTSPITDYVVCYFSVGSTIRWTKIGFRVSPTPVFTGISRPGAYACSSCSSRIACAKYSQGVSVPATFLCSNSWGHNSGSSNRSTPTTNTAQYSAALSFADPWYGTSTTETNVFAPGQAGELGYSVTPTSSTKGWDTSYGIAGTAPTDVATPGNYYWVTFGPFTLTYPRTAGTTNGEINYRSGDPVAPGIYVEYVR